MNMRVGLTRTRVVQGLKVNAVIGVFALLCGIVAAVRADPARAPSVAHRLAWLCFLLVVPSGIWLVMAAILCSITLRLTNGTVEQVLWGKFVLQRRALADLTRVSGGSFSAMVLHFRGGKKIALPGIHAEDARRFLEALDRLRPELRLLGEG